ncbi:MAG: hypothetical protein ORN98_03880 [Alphaproteobacteria bacterium]|nr:hypothetical protein [Alphaproteobacteria bacterium]
MSAVNFAEFVDAADAEAAKTNGKARKLGELNPKWVQTLSNYGIMLESHEIFIRDTDIRHSLRPNKHKPILKRWFQNLPFYWLRPDAVLLDTTHHEGLYLLLIYQYNSVVYKLVVRLNYFVRKQGVMNIIVTGSQIDVNESGIKSLIGKGYDFIDGTL